MEDELYPNNGEAVDTFWQPTEPEDQKRRRKNKESDASANKKLLERVIERLETKIAHYHTTNAYPDIDMANLDDFRTRILANKQTVANLETELNYWKEELKAAK